MSPRPRLPRLTGLDREQIKNLAVDNDFQNQPLIRRIREFFRSEVDRQSGWGQGEKRSTKLDETKLEETVNLLKELDALGTIKQMSTRVYGRVISYLSHMRDGDMHHHWAMQRLIDTMEGLFPPPSEPHGQGTNSQRSSSPEEVSLVDVVEQMCAELQDRKTEALSQHARLYADTIRKLAQLVEPLKVQEGTGAGSGIGKSLEGGSASASHRDGTSVSSMQFEHPKVSSNEVIQEIYSYFSNWGPENSKPLSEEAVSIYVKTIGVLGEMAESLNTEQGNAQTDAGFDTSIAEGSGKKRGPPTASDSPPHRRSRRSQTPDEVASTSDVDAEGDTDEDES